MAKSSQSLIEELQAAFSQIEEDRLEALRGLRQIQAVSQSLFQSEAERLAKKLGKNCPRVSSIKVEFCETEGAAHIRALHMYVDSARLAICAPAAQGFTVAGWVTDWRRRGKEALVVNVYHRDHGCEEKLGSTLTHSDGFFGIHFDPQRLPDPAQVRREVCVELIDNRSGSRLYTSPEPVPCSPGRIELLCIRIGEAHGSCRKAVRPTRGCS